MDHNTILKNFRRDVTTFYVKYKTGKKKEKIKRQFL